MTPREDSNEFPNPLEPDSDGQDQDDGFGIVPDPFNDEAVEPDDFAPLSPTELDSAIDLRAPIPAPPPPPNLRERGRARTRRVQDGDGPIPDPEESQQRPANSGVRLTPKGLETYSDEVEELPAPPTRELQPRPAARSNRSKATKAGDADLSWEEYAADHFPAMASEDFGVKTRKTDSGRMVPVAIRADLTDEAIKNKSIKGKQGKQAKPAKKAKAAPEAPKSLLGRIGNTLRLTRPAPEEDEEPEAKKKTGTGFARSGSLPTRTRRRRSQRREKTPLGIAWSITVEVVKILMLVLLLRAYVLQVSQVQGPSMQGTLVDGDRLVVERVTPLIANNVDKWWLSWLPDFLTPELKRGDIIVLRSPEDPGIELVKRLIGLPGDTLRFENGYIWMRQSGTADFVRLPETYLSAESLAREDGTMKSYRGAHSLGEYIREGMDITVPQNRIFVLGDNRNQSNDSRGWLEVDVRRTDSPQVDRLWAHTKSVEGRVVLRIWPYDRTWPPVQ